MTGTNLVHQLAHFFDRRDSLKIAGLLLVILVGSVLDVLSIGLVLPLVVALGEPEGLLGYPLLGPLLRAVGATDQKGIILAVGVGVPILFILKTIYLTLQWRAVYGFIYSRLVMLATRLLEAYIRAPYTFHLQRNSAELLRNIDVEVHRVYRGVVEPLVTILTESLLALGVLILLLVVQPAGATAAFLLLVIGGLAFVKYARRRLEREGKSRLEHQGEAIKWVNESLGSIKEIKLLGREDVFLEGFGRSARALGNAIRENVLFAQYPRLVVELLGVFAIIILLLVLYLPSGSLTDALPVLVLFGVAVTRLMPSFNRIMASMNAIRFSAPAVAAVHQQLVEAETAAAAVYNSSNIHPQSLSGYRGVADGSKPGSAARLPFHERINVKGISFGYSETQHPVLKDITLSVQRGERVAIVGDSGAGKTTLVNVILGLLEPSAGSVLVDAVDIRQNISGWQRRLGYVPQDVYLLDGTVRRNVAFGLTDEEIDDEHVWRALKAAQLESFVRSMPDGLDSLVGERGVRISGGQRQRIGVARALCHQPDVLVLDEATSSLDYEAERGVMAAIEDLPGTTTVIIVTHRLSSVRNCDRIHLLEDGHIAGAGTYQNLAAVNSHFSSLVAAAEGIKRNEFTS